MIGIANCNPNPTLSHLVHTVQYRAAVEVLFEFLTDGAERELLPRIVSTEVQPVIHYDTKDGRKRIIKIFRVYDADLFVLALKFKAALNHAVWQRALAQA